MFATRPTICAVRTASTIAPIRRPVDGEPPQSMIDHICSPGVHDFRQKQALRMQNNMRYVIVATHASYASMKVHFVVEVDEAAGCLLLCTSRVQYMNFLSKTTQLQRETMYEELKSELRSRARSFTCKDGSRGLFRDAR